MARLLTTALDDDAREKDVYHQLLEREKLGNTGIGNGVAVPHSRCNQATTAIVAIISLHQPIDFDSIDKQEVDLAFGLLVPKEASQEHLNLLADIARLVSDPDKKHQLSVAKMPSEVIELIGSWSDIN
jgi:PTS system nitrogen regulatory IIA component